MIHIFFKHSIGNGFAPFGVVFEMHEWLTSLMHVVLQNICCPLSFVLVGVTVFDISLVPKAYHLRREETDWFDKPRESRLENGHGLDRKLPERLVHSRPLSQHQEQVSTILSNLF